MNKHLVLERNPRTGVCSVCHKRVGYEIKKTHIHHEVYDIDKPLANTVELCVGCHRRRHKLLHINICYGCGCTSWSKWWPNKPTDLRICDGCHWRIFRRPNLILERAKKKK